MMDTETIFGLVILFVFGASYSESQIYLDYSMLKNLGASCSPLDTCSIPRDSDHLGYYRCQCGPNCVDADSCCIDSPYIQYIATAERHESATCHSVNRNDHLNVMMVSKCDPDWEGDPFVKYMCENRCSYNEKTKDPLIYVPMTSIRSYSTYSNYFCAVCNNDENESKFWNINIQRLSDYYKPNMDKISLEDLKYNAEKKRWVLNIEGNTQFADITFRPSESLLDYIQSCVKHLISDCHPNWNPKDYVKKLCHAYMAIVYVPDKGIRRYRNVHCAVCNYANFTRDTFCDPLETTFYGDTIGRKPSGSYTLVLDLNDDRLPLMHRCGSGNLYDPFCRSCRSLACALPGYVQNENGECVHPRSLKSRPFIASFRLLPQAET